MNTLMELPEIGTDLSADPAAEIQSRRCGALKRWWRSLRSSIRCIERYGAELARISCAREWKWSRATFAQPGLGLAPEVSKRLQKNLDLIINSSGLTDFNPDLRDALATNVDAAVNVTRIRAPVGPRRPAASFHLLRGGRARWPGGRDDCARTTLRRESLTSTRKRSGARCMHLSSKPEQQAERPEVTEELRQQALSKEHAAKDLQRAGAGQSDPQESLPLAARTI